MEPDADVMIGRVLHVSRVDLVTRVSDDVFDRRKFDRRSAAIVVRFRRQRLVSNEADHLSSVVSDGFGDGRCLVEVFESVSPALFIVAEIVELVNTLGQTLSLLHGESHLVSPDLHGDAINTGAVRVNLMAANEIESFINLKHWVLVALWIWQSSCTVP